MTLKEFFELCTAHPFLIIIYFILIPFTAYVAGMLGRGEGHLSPWKFLYSALIYLVAVPGIFAVSLNIYLFLFERQSVFNMNLYTQVLPIISMVFTLWLIRKNVSLDYIPGFDKLGGLVMVIGGALAIMWVLDKTRIWLVSFMRFEIAVLIFVGLIVAIKIGWSRIFGSPERPMNPENYSSFDK